MEKQQQNLTLMDLEFGGDEGLWKQYHSNCVTHTILATFTSEVPGAARWQWLTQDAYLAGVAQELGYNDTMPRLVPLALCNPVHRHYRQERKEWKTQEHTVTQLPHQEID